jgi:hypothetical protein
MVKEKQSIFLESFLEYSLSRNGIFKMKIKLINKDVMNPLLNYYGIEL